MTQHRITEVYETLRQKYPVLAENNNKWSASGLDATPFRNLVEPTHDYPSTRAEWERHTRPSLIETFEREVYGHKPDGDIELTWKVLEEGPAGPGQIRRQIALTCTGPLGEMTVTLLAYLPEVFSAVFPAFLGLNFSGNHTTTTDPAVLRSSLQRTEDAEPTHYENLYEKFDIPPERGTRAHRWPFQMITDRGYAAVTLNYLQMGPDHTTIFTHGAHRLVSTTRLEDRPESHWGAIGMWAWTLSRVLDALERGMIAEVDTSRVIAMGHSRLGKTALWAAAADQRFAAAISNNSGCMGAAATREMGEVPEVLARIRPYWFTRTFSERVLAREPLPVDQHQLLACIAPRPLYVASASEDDNADPKGEFLSWLTARVAWKLYGITEPETAMPPPGEAVGGIRAPLRYHIRSGAHDVTRFDWQHWLDFADRWVVGSSDPRPGRRDRSRGRGSLVDDVKNAGY